MSDFCITSVAFDPELVLNEKTIRLPRLRYVEPKEMSDLTNYAGYLVLDQHNNYHIVSYGAVSKAGFTNKGIPPITNKKLLDKVNASKMEIIEYV